jgi:hypothetical protein
MVGLTKSANNFEGLVEFDKWTYLELSPYKFLSGRVLVDIVVGTIGA